MQPFSPTIRTNTHPLVVAHRGISSRAPENTLASFTLAVQTDRIDMIELDVRLTRDEEVIVLHDRSLQRTTTGNGTARSYTFSELQKFDAGSWFDPAFSSERIPSLKSVLELVRGKRWVDIELKSDPLHREPSGLLERRVMEVVEACDMQDQVMFSSFDHRLLRTLKRLRPDAHMAALRNVLSNAFQDGPTVARAAEADILVLGKGQLSERKVRHAHDAGIAVFVYTVNSHEEVRRAVDMGVDAVISDNADEVVNLVRR